MMIVDSDKDLINNYFKDGDEQSLEILIKRYLKLVDEILKVIKLFNK